MRLPVLFTKINLREKSKNLSDGQNIFLDLRILPWTCADVRSESTRMKWHSSGSLCQHFYSRFLFSGVYNIAIKFIMG
jgi:hypothetical protein